MAQANRDQLRSGLLGPLGEETTDMLMEELDQAGLRSHVDERFDEQRRYVDKRFDQIDQRLDRFEGRIDALGIAIVQFGRDSNRLVYTVSAAMIVLALATLMQIALGA